jgi:hypothetical protein
MSSSVEREGIEVKDAMDFILGGHSEFTIKNLNSGKEFKYKVTEASDKKGMFFIKVLMNGSYQYAGYLKVDSYGMYYTKGKKGILEGNSEPIKGITWAIRKGKRPLPRPMIMYHHGRCACCGRALDDEKSIERGFGPVCWDRLQAREEAMNND